jgi:hypothetical protein
LAELQQAATAGTAIVDKEQAQEDFLCLFEDLYMEFSKFGKLDALHVCDNLGDHMIGTYNLYGLGSFVWLHTLSHISLHIFLFFFIILLLLLIIIII